MKATPAVEKGIGVLSLNLTRWGVSPEDAVRTTAAWIKAYNIREIKTWTDLPDATTTPPEQIVEKALDGSESLSVFEFSYELLEEAVFACFYSDIRRLADVVSKISALRVKFESDPLAFWKRLGNYSSKKSAGPAWTEKQPAWTFFVLEYWIGRGLPEEIPPVCLWTDETIKQLAGAPNDPPSSTAGERSTTLNQFLRREPRCLFRPKGKAYSFRKGQWVEVIRR